MYTQYVVLINVAYSLEGDQLGVNCMTYTQYVAHNNVACSPEKLAMWMYNSLLLVFELFVSAVRSAHTPEI